MRELKPRRRAPLPAALSLGSASLILCAQLQAGSSDALAACARIAQDAARLACYDGLAQRGGAAAKPQSPAGAATAPGAAPPDTPAAAASGSPEDFGVHRPTYPAAPTGPRSISGRVIGVGVDANGHMTVRLDGAGVWALLEGADPLLARGDEVTIRRASFDSFILRTPSGREHRVRRQQ
ncbi:MAG: hypothetical protein JOZ67_11365 [Gammaproteobacteria bacterium]|nr:hypothetical protein [Gammaproteobacteria bacterium]MBV9696055.1 hypothetical protein [Gammaproteobacteria bacterium]